MRMASAMVRPLGVDASGIAARLPVQPHRAHTSRSDGFTGCPHSGHAYGFRAFWCCASAADAETGDAGFTSSALYHSPHDPPGDAQWMLMRLSARSRIRTVPT